MACLYYCNKKILNWCLFFYSFPPKSSSDTTHSNLYYMKFVLFNSLYKILLLWPTKFYENWPNVWFSAPSFIMNSLSPPLQFIYISPHPIIIFYRFSIYFLHSIYFNMNLHFLLFISFLPRCLPKMCFSSE